MAFVAAASLSSDDTTALFLSLALMLAAARLLGEVARKLGQPSVVGEILAGILLGPTLMTHVSPAAYAWLFPADTASPTRIGQDWFFTLAAAFLLLVAGLEVELRTVMRQGRAMLMVSGVGVLLPFALGSTVALVAPRLVGGAPPDTPLLPFAIFIGIALSITALPVIAKILMDLSMLKSDLGMLVMSGAMLNDLVGWMGFAVVLSLSSGGDDSVGRTLLLTVVFLAGMLTVFRYLSHKVLPIIQARLAYPGGVITFVLFVALASAAATEHIGIHSIFGAFIAGVAIGDSRHLKERTRDTIHQFITNIFSPVFFASIGVRVNFVEAFDLITVVTVLIIAVAGKISGSYAGARWAGMSKRESAAVGFGMVAQGTMGVLLGQLARQSGLIGEETFVAIIIVALITSLIAGPAMQRLLRVPQPRRLSVMISDRTLVHGLRATDAREAIRELADRAAPLTGIDPLIIDQAVWDREQTMRTGLPGGLAVPHARLAEIKKPLVVFARSQTGIDFDAPDGQPANLLFLLLTPLNDQTVQLELLSAIGRAFQHESARQAVLSARNTTEVVAAVNMAENALAH